MTLMLSCKPRKPVNGQRETYFEGYLLPRTLNLNRRTKFYCVSEFTGGSSLGHMQRHMRESDTHHRGDVYLRICPSLVDKISSKKQDIYIWDFTSECPHGTDARWYSPWIRHVWRPNNIVSIPTMWTCTCLGSTPKDLFFNCIFGLPNIVWVGS